MHVLQQQHVHVLSATGLHDGLVATTYEGSKEAMVIAFAVVVINASWTRCACDLGAETECIAGSCMHIPAADTVTMYVHMVQRAEMENMRVAGVLPVVCCCTFKTTAANMRSVTVSWPPLSLCYVMLLWNHTGLPFLREALHMGRCIFRT